MISKKEQLEYMRTHHNSLSKDTYTQVSKDQQRKEAYAQFEEVGVHDPAG